MCTYVYVCAHCLCIILITCNFIKKNEYQYIVIIVSNHHIFIGTASLLPFGSFTEKQLKFRVKRKQSASHFHTSEMHKAAAGREGTEPWPGSQDSMTSTSPFELFKLEFVHPENVDTVNFLRGLWKDSIK